MKILVCPALGSELESLKFFISLSSQEHISQGMEEATKMETLPLIVEPDLTKYFEGIKKGSYFSITKRFEIRKNEMAKKGVIALQKTLKDGGFWQKAQTELNKPNSQFRKDLEKTPAGRSRKLFARSLRYFDQIRTLEEQSIPGNYYHATRLAVAYFQWSNSLGVDGSFGKKSYEKLKGCFRSPEQAAEETSVRKETRAREEKLKETIKNNDAITEAHIAFKRLYKDIYPVFQEQLNGRDMEGGWFGLIEALINSATSANTKFAKKLEAIGITPEQLEDIKKTALAEVATRKDEFDDLDSNSHFTHVKRNAVMDIASAILFGQPLFNSRIKGTVGSLTSFPDVNSVLKNLPKNGENYSGTYSELLNKSVEQLNTEYTNSLDIIAAGLDSTRADQPHEVRALNETSSKLKNRLNQLGIIIDERGQIATEKADVLQKISYSGLLIFGERYWSDEGKVRKIEARLRILRSKQTSNKDKSKALQFIYNELEQEMKDDFGVNISGRMDLSRETTIEEIGSPIARVGSERYEKFTAIRHSDGSLEIATTYTDTMRGDDEPERHTIAVLRKNRPPQIKENDSAYRDLIKRTQRVANGAPEIELRSSTVRNRWKNMQQLSRMKETVQLYTNNEYRMQQVHDVSKQAPGRQFKDSVKHVLFLSEQQNQGGNPSQFIAPLTELVRNSRKKQKLNNLFNTYFSEKETNPTQALDNLIRNGGSTLREWAKCAAANLKVLSQTIAKHGNNIHQPTDALNYIHAGGHVNQRFLISLIGTGYVNMFGGKDGGPGEGIDKITPSGHRIEKIVPTRGGGSIRDVVGSIF